MIYILDLLNKIKWDDNEIPEDYTLVYYDKVSNINKEIKLTDIKDIENLFIVLEVKGKEVNIPLHRIKEVKKEGKIIWKR
ncbi:DUF504 domain-containing protein [archaeon]|nr:DUF504 domain-containing protein [archaeon]